MPIRFRCRRCNVLLSISSRKAGSEINCPKCSVAQTVPAADATASDETLNDAQLPAAEEMPPAPVTAQPAAKATFSNKPPLVAREPAPAPSETPATEEATADGPLTVMVYEAVLEPDETPAPVPQSPTAVASPAEALPAAPEEPVTKSEAAPPESLAADLPLMPLPAPATPVPGGMILYRRRTLYIHGMLFVLLALVGFGAGYWIGRGNATLKLQVEHEEAVRNRVMVEGLLTWLPEPQVKAPDENAVVIALPEGKAPPKLIPMVGLRSVDPPPDESHKGVRAIKELGGDYTRTDAKGAFAIVVPDQGRYRLLIISRHAGRKGDPFSQDADMAEIGGYFQSPELLIGRYKYRWTSEELKPGFNAIEFSFGQDGK